MSNTTKKFAIGAALAAVAGYVTGVLTAPKSGRETRKDIKTAAIVGKHEAERQLKRLHTELNDVISQARERAEKLNGDAKKDIDKALRATRQVKEAVRDVLSAVHEGRADDKVLQQSIDEAQKSIDHLKTFIKKKASATK